MEEDERRRRLSFMLRVIQNQIKALIRKDIPKSDFAPQSQLQGGILGYLYHHREEPVYQKDIEKEFRISRATATNTLQVMERNGLIVRRSQDRDGRLKRIFMTEEAAADHDRVDAHMAMMDERMLRGLTEGEVSDLYRYLDVIMRNLEELNRERGIPEENDCRMCLKRQLPEDEPAKEL